MHTNVILTNKKRTDAESNYTNTKLKAWFSWAPLTLSGQQTEWVYSAAPDLQQRKKLVPMFSKLAHLTAFVGKLSLVQVKSWRTACWRPLIAYRWTNYSDDLARQDD